MPESTPTTKEAPKQAKREYHFPALGVTVEASSLAEAEALTSPKEAK